MRLTVNGIRYHVETSGAGEPLLLLHGFTGSMATWEPFVAAWSRRMRVIRIDLLGHGETDSPADFARYAVEHAAADLANVLDRLHVRQTHLLGYSMGGRLALAFALMYPERVKTLVLESSSPGIASLAERQNRIAHDGALADRIEKEGVAAFTDHWESLPLFASQSRLPAAVREQIRAGRLKNNPRGLANSLRGMGAGAQPSYWQNLPQLSLPVLILAGELDAKYCAIGQKVKNMLPQAQLRIVPDAGHTVHVEQSEIFATIVMKFLQGRN
ncbi:MAG TPA: 2-succinyl-6-hydroxy-2,4-cyclohexadiene-1-carboxylate synthase [Bacilli bacterium]